MTEAPEAPAESPPWGETCQNCGAPGERGQLVCLECGRRMGLDYRRPPGWKLPVAIIVVVVAVLGVVFGLVLQAITNDSDNEVAKAGAGKARPKAHKPAAKAKPRPAKAKPKPKAKAKAKPKARPKARSRAKRRAAALAGVPRWPARRDGYTVVLLSGDTRGSARSFASTARKGGTRVGVLRSNDYSSLEKGFWIVFSGVYPSRPKAEQAATRLSKGFPGAFPQFVNGSKRR
jgi:pyruvate/2-oxoglutarate dehydrogenase complex dihydrolipoamide acyltransferase (E2) component